MTDQPNPHTPNTPTIPEESLRRAFLDKTRTLHRHSRFLLTWAVAHLNEHATPQDPTVTFPLKQLRADLEAVGLPPDPTNQRLQHVAENLFTHAHARVNQDAHSISSFQFLEAITLNLDGTPKHPEPYLAIRFNPTVLPILFDHRHCQPDIPIAPLTELTTTTAARLAELFYAHYPQNHLTFPLLDLKHLLDLVDRIEHPDGTLTWENERYPQWRDFAKQLQRAQRDITQSALPVEFEFRGIRSGRPTTAVEFIVHFTDAPD